MTAINAFVGQTESGKTHACISLLRLAQDKKIIIFGEFLAPFKKGLPNAAIHKNYDLMFNKELISKADIVVIDDFVNVVDNYKSEINALLNTIRHQGVKTYVILQDYHQLPRKARTAISTLYLLNSTPSAREAVAKDYDLPKSENGVAINPKRQKEMLFCRGDYFELFEIGKDYSITSIKEFNS